MKKSILGILATAAIATSTILYAADPTVKGTAVVPRSAVEDTAYNATSWNGNTNVATKNALRDKIETLSTSLSDPFVVTSALANNATNIAMVVDTTWDTGEALQVWRINGEDKAWIFPAGGFLSTDRLIASPDPDNFAQGFVGGQSGYAEVAGPGYTNVVVINADNDWFSDVGIAITVDEANSFTAWLRPGIGATETPFKFDTQGVSHTSGNLVSVGNNTTNVFAVGFQGAVTAAQAASEPAAPAAGYFTLFGIDNGGGKMILKVRFPTGASQTIATEP